MENQMMTVKEVAQYLHLHQSSVYRLLKRKGLPAVRIGSDWRFRRESVDRWVESREMSGTENSNA